jgi:hypothetical protein
LIALYLKNCLKDHCYIGKEKMIFGWQTKERIWKICESILMTLVSLTDRKIREVWGGFLPILPPTRALHLLICRLRRKKKSFQRSDIAVLESDLYWMLKLNFWILTPWLNFNVLFDQKLNLPFRFHPVKYLFCCQPCTVARHWYC